MMIYIMMAVLGIGLGGDGEPALRHHVPENWTSQNGYPIWVYSTLGGGRNW